MPRPPRHDTDEWRPVPLIIVPPGELTCTECGETTTDPYCYRCADMKGQIGHNKPGDSPTTLILTTSYLYPEEYRTPCPPRSPLPL